MKPTTFDEQEVQTLTGLLNTHLRKDGYFVNVEKTDDKYNLLLACNSTGFLLMEMLQVQPLSVVKMYILGMISTYSIKTSPLFNLTGN